MHLIMAWSNQTKNTSTYYTVNAGKRGFDYARFDISLFDETNQTYTNQAKNTANYNNQTKH